VTSGVSENLNVIKSNFYGDHQGFNLGIFSQLEAVFTDRLRATTGIRLEQNWLDTEFDKLIPLFRAGLNYRVFDYTFLRASFGQGYRFPSVAEKYASTTLGSVRIFPSLFIQPEKGWNAEIGAKQGIAAGGFTGFVDLAFFYSQNTNMIEFIFGNYPVPGKDQYGLGFKATNTEASRVYGTELQASFLKTSGRISQNLNGGYVFLHPVEFNINTGKNTGVMLKYRRKHSFTANYDLSAGKLRFGISLFMKSKMLNIDDVFVNPMTREDILPGFYDYWNKNNKGYALADANIGYQINRGFKLSCMVKNITNTIYMGRPGDIQPQRNFSLRLSGEF
jgi:iron complex outermembrane receptor protein